MIHVHGFVHCDPHPGNLFVRAHPEDGRWQLVVLDHGMYRRLTPQFRAAYCRLWKVSHRPQTIVVARLCRVCARAHSCCMHACVRRI